MDEVTKQLRQLKEDDPMEFKKLLLRLPEVELEPLLYDWSLWARGNQLPPKGLWRIWMILAGRGLIY